MKRLPVDRPHGLDFLLPDDWTPAQALAVVELLDDLRERIYSHYLIPIQVMLKEDRSAGSAHHRRPELGEEPF